MTLKEIIENTFAGGGNELIFSYLYSKGLNKRCSEYFVSQLKSAWEISKFSFDQKIWALENGFLPDKLFLYSLSEKNKNDYLSDIDYLKLHPLNNHFAFWINDKLTLKYMLSKHLQINSFSQSGVYIDLMPEYYLYIENDGSYSYLMDAPLCIPKSKEFIISLLHFKKELALKPSNGAGGKGFFHFSVGDSGFKVNDVPVELDELKSIIYSLKGYIVTEFITQNSQLSEIWNNSSCTLRIIVCKTSESQYEPGKYNVITSYARFGTSKSGGSSNLSSGGVGAPFNFETGEFEGHFYRYKALYPDEDIILTNHPDSKISIKGKSLPNYKLVKESIYSLCNYFSSLEYFGFDIIITEDGLKLCEINSLPSLDYEQIMQGPIFKNKFANQFFSKKLQQFHK